MAENVEAFRLERIGQISVPVKDVDRAMAFYRDKLGMKLLFQAPPGLAFFACGDVRLMLSVPEKPELAHPASILYYRVEDIEAAHAALRDRGVCFEHAPSLVHRAETYELWMAFLRDSEGNLLALMCEKPVAP
jgi:predicted enzyme related to lactoylglutathione lyase